MIQKKTNNRNNKISLLCNHDGFKSSKGLSLHKMNKASNFSGVKTEVFKVVVGS